MKAEQVTYSTSQQYFTVQCFHWLYLQFTEFSLPSPYHPFLLFKDWSTGWMELGQTTRPDRKMKLPFGTKALYQELMKIRQFLFLSSHCNLSDKFSASDYTEPQIILNHYHEFVIYIFVRCNNQHYTSGHHIHTKISMKNILNHYIQDVYYYF